MFLKSLLLRNFRNYTDAIISFDPKINVIAGKNAQGKTNLLEAIYLLSCGRSFRTQYLHELIQKGKSFFYLEATLVKNGVQETLRLHYDGKQRKFQSNSTLYLSFNPLLGVMPSVLHAPSDTHLISGTPALRRRFFNIHLAQHDPNYVHHLVRFFKAMKQRNMLLKTKDFSSIDCWEEEMATSAFYLTFKRNQMITSLQENLKNLTKELLQLQFNPSLPPEEDHKIFKNHYLKKLQSSRFKEVVYGYTLLGPHHDDFEFLINGMSARLYASEGQKESALFALRLAEWERLCKETDLQAIMSIDDFGLHLDDERRKLLQNFMDHFAQVFITTPSHPTEWESFDKAKIIYIEDGSVPSL